MHDPVDPNVHFPDLEEEIREWWAKQNIADEVLAHREGSEEFVFYEGPPTANTSPPLHGVWPRAYKDVYTRFQTMLGKYVPRKAGWDCHGLPVEIEIEKRLGFTRKQQIVDYGIAEFNALCRESVTGHVEEFERFSERLGFWLDYGDPYRTMDDTYIESVWWSLAELHDRGMLYEGDRVTPWCPRCETPLSDHEVSLGYQEVEDPGVTIAFPLVSPAPVNGVSLEDAGLAVWTTTPWTLISNLAAAVHPDITYALAEAGGRRLILARDLVERVLGDEAEVVTIFPGSALVGLRYRPPFDFARAGLTADEATRDDAEANGWRVLAADFVNVEEGTGVVHMAAAFGADDLDACREAGIPTFNPVDPRGRFDQRVPDFQGHFVKEADPDIVRRLDDEGVLLRSEPYRHAYPHCWRCDAPLLYYARKSWYIRTTAVRDRLLEVNRDVRWIPEHIRDGRYGNWLENNVDWSLSRYRFWGTPLPIWRCPEGHDTAIESRAKLSDAAGRDLSELDLHRPYVDEVGFPCPECGAEARRVPDLIDVWYDSGAMPFAQWHYPHENIEIFRRRFPAHFIAEAIDQTRGWFYSLMAEGVLLFDDSAYRTVLCHGHLLDEEGRKMSSSKGNVMDPWDVFSRYGADPLRFYIFSGGQPGDNRQLGPTVLQEVVRGPFLTLWNVYRLYVLYANIDGFHPDSWTPIVEGLRPALDRWALSELHQLILEVDEALTDYDSLRASRRIAEFVDDLSNWYVRRSRRRFWREATSEDEEADKSAAYWTLWTCLTELTKLLAPFTPFLAESLYQNLVRRVNDRAPRSVHLCDFPSADASLIDPFLAQGMFAARSLTSLGRAARDQADVKVRQPLGEAVLLVPPDLIEAVADVAPTVADELNVREISFVSDEADLVRFSLKPNFRTAGPEFGPKVQALAGALSALTPEEARSMAETLEAGEPIDVEVEGGETLRTEPEHVEIRREPAEGTAFAYQAPFGVSLDLEVTPDLRREGLARELVHQLQTARKEADLEVTDRITLALSAPEEVVEAVREHEDYVREEVLATSLDMARAGAALGAGAEGAPLREISVDGFDVQVALERVS